MPSTAASGRPRAGPGRRVPAPRRRRLAGLVALALFALVTLVLTAFESGGARSDAAETSVAASRLLPAGPPRPQVIAVQSSLRIQLPISQSRLTAIGYHAVGDRALPLEPVGRHANAGLLTRLFRRIFGESGGGLSYYRLGGGQGPATGALDVGAAAGTDVYSPVDGTVVGITDYVLNGRRYGSRIDLRPSVTPSLVVSLTRLRPDPGLTVGSSVVAATSKLGALVDFSAVERQALARYTQDAGNHVSLEVHPAATLSVP